MSFKIGYGLVGIVFGAAIILSGCSTNGDTTIHKDPAAINGDFSGKDFSGSFAVVPLAGDIPHVAASKGQQGRWAPDDRDQVLYLDAFCQQKLFERLPGWAQAIAKEGGWQALVTAVGEAGFAAASPGAPLVREFLGGLGYGFPAGANTGRYRQDTSEKASQGYCALEQIWDERARYHILEGIIVVPWYGDGQATLPDPTDLNTKPSLPHVDLGNTPPFH